MGALQTGWLDFKLGAAGISDWLGITRGEAASIYANATKAQALADAPQDPDSQRAVAQDPRFVQLETSLAAQEDATLAEAASEIPGQITTAAVSAVQSATPDQFKVEPAVIAFAAVVIVAGLFAAGYALKHVKGLVS